MTIDLVRNLEGFEPISLPELESHAALQTRVDRKYIVDYDTLERLLAQLGDDYLALEIDGDRLQQYDSIYFDTPALTGYRHHMQRRRRRFKCRTRLYGGTACFFDLKLKGSQGETVKRRLSLPPAAHGSLTTDARTFLRQELLQEYGITAPAVLMPTLHTSFARLALTHISRPERLTFDFGIAFAGVEGDERHGIRREHVLIEAKSGAAMGTVDRLLPRLGVRPLTMCSKYCLGVALTQPGLTSNPYRWLLRRYFVEIRSQAPLGALRPREPRQRSMGIQESRAPAGR